MSYINSPMATAVSDVKSSIRYIYLYCQKLAEFNKKKWPNGYPITDFIALLYSDEVTNSSYKLKHQLPFPLMNKVTSTHSKVLLQLGENHIMFDTPDLTLDEPKSFSVQNKNYTVLHTEYAGKQNIDVSDSILKTDQVINELNAFSTLLTMSESFYNELGDMTSFWDDVEKDELIEFVKKYRDNWEVLYLIYLAANDKSQLMMLNAMKENKIELSHQNMEQLIEKIEVSYKLVFGDRFGNDLMDLKKSITNLRNDFLNVNKSFSLFNRFALEKKLNVELKTNNNKEGKMKI